LKQTQRVASAASHSAVPHGREFEAGGRLSAIVKDETARCRRVEQVAQTEGCLAARALARHCSAGRRFQA